MTDTDTLCSGEVITHINGWLQRGGRTWRLPVCQGRNAVMAIDDLFVGDTLWFPPLEHPPANLIAKVVFSVGRTFASQRCQGAYELSLSVSCPECHSAAPHPVVIADYAKHAAGGPVWAFDRICGDCEAVWEQDGKRVECTGARW